MKRVDNSCKGGGGYLVSSAIEFTSLFSDFLNNRVTSPEVTNSFLRKGKTDNSEELNYGYGIGITADSKGNLFYSHSGSGLGSNSVIIILPDEKIVVTLLGNREDNSMNTVAYQVAKIFQEK